MRWRLAYCSTSHLPPSLSKLTSTLALPPRPSKFSTTPSPEHLVVDALPEGELGFGHLGLGDGADRLGHRAVQANLL